MLDKVKDEPTARTAKFLGGGRKVGATIFSPLSAHDVLERGLPTKALLHVLDGLTALDRAAVLSKAIGISERTLQRARLKPAALLPTDVSARIWSFAQVLSRATDVFGTQQAAEEWLQRPAMALENRTPLSLLSTPEGREMVLTVLGQIDYGVYI